MQFNCRLTGIHMGQDFIFYYRITNQTNIKELIEQK